MALPTIATNWSGPTAFMDASNAFPLEVESIVPVGSGEHPAHGWAQPSVRHLRRLMRRVFEDREGARAIGLRARRDMVDKFSPAPVARLVAARLREVEIRIAEQDAAVARQAAEGEGGGGGGGKGEGEGEGKRKGGRSGGPWENTHREL